MIRRSFFAGAGALLTSACAGIPAKEAEARWPPVGDILTVDGLPVHVWQQGSGRPVVLIHGASGNLRDWTYALAPQLAQSFRVIAFDRPGFGYSARLPQRGWDPAVQAVHLAKAADQLDVREAIVVGHSWGGALAMAWALEAPSAPKGIVTLGGATMPWGGDLAFYYSLAASDVTGFVTARLLSAFASEARIQSVLEEIFEPQPVPVGYADFVGAALATRPATIRHNARDITNLDALLQAQSARYKDLTLPVEILHGTADTTVYPDIHAEGMHRVLANSRLNLLDGIGHMPHHASQEAVIDAVSRIAQA